MKPEILQTRGYTNGNAGAVGFVLTYDELMKRYCVRTGVYPADAIDTDESNKHIALNGAKVDLPVALALFPNGFNVVFYDI